MPDQSPLAKLLQQPTTAPAAPTTAPAAPTTAPAAPAAPVTPTTPPDTSESRLAKLLQQRNLLDGMADMTQEQVRRTSLEEERAGNLEAAEQLKQEWMKRHVAAKNRSPGERLLGLGETVIEGAKAVPSAIGEIAGQTMQTVATVADAVAGRDEDERLKARATLLLGSQTGASQVYGLLGTGLYEMWKEVGRQLSQEDATEEDAEASWEKRKFFSDVERRLYEGKNPFDEDENNPLMEYVGWDRERLAERGITIDPADVLAVADITDATNLLGLGLGIKLLTKPAIKALGGNKFSVTALKDGKEVVIGKGFSKAEADGMVRTAKRRAQPSSLRRATVSGSGLAAAGNTFVNTGDPVMSALAGVGTTGVAAGTLKFAGPVSRFVARSPEFKGAVGATVGFAVPTMFALDDPEDRGQQLAGNFGLGLAIGASTRPIQFARNVVGASNPYNLFRAHMSQGKDKVAPSAYGISRKLDAINKRAAKKLDPAAHNFFEGVRDIFRAREGDGFQSAEIYLYDDADSVAAFKELYPNLPDERLQQMATASQGVTAGRNEAGRDIALVRVGSQSLGHEAGHLLLSLMPADEAAALRQQVVDTYGQETIDGFAAHYNELLNRGGEVKRLTPQQAIDEMIAENFSAALNGIPVGQGVRSRFSDRIYNSLGKFLESAGVRPKAPTSPMGVVPNFKLAEVLRNVAIARNFDTSQPNATAPSADSVDTAPAPAPEVVPVADTPVEPVEPADPGALDFVADWWPSAQTRTPSAATPPAATPSAATPSAATPPAATPSAATPSAATPSAATPSAATPPAATPPAATPPAATPPAATPPAATPSAPGTPKAPEVAIAEELAKPIAERQVLVGKYSSVDDTGTRKKAKYAQRRADQADQGSTRTEQEKRIVVTNEARPGHIFAYEPGIVDENIQVLREIVSDLGVTVPYSLNTSEGVSALRADFDAYAANQLNGYAGSGASLTRPVGVSQNIHPENPNYTPVQITQDRVDVLNLLVGDHPPKTLRASKDREPRNVTARRLARANGRKGFDIGTKTIAIGDETFQLGDFNPLRQEIVRAGEEKHKIDMLTELRGSIRPVVNQLRVEHFTGDLTPIGSAPVPQTDLAHAGFMPEMADWARIQKVSDGAKPIPGVDFAEFHGFDRAGEPYGLKPIEYWNLTEEIGKYEFKEGQRPTLTRQDIEALQAARDTTGAFMPNTGVPGVREVAERYMEKAGLPYRPHEGYLPVDPDLSMRIADFVETVESNPQDPRVQKAYRALADETRAQWDVMVADGITAEPWLESGQPYANSAEMVADVRDNKHMYFFLTESGFGKGDNAVSNHPMLESTGITLNDKPLVVNDLFRVVHDYFGHSKEGYQFGPRGEWNAYVAHSRMFTDTARPALAAETAAQNAWVNYGPHLRNEKGDLIKRGEPGYVPPADRPFADQKIFVLPDDLMAEVDQKAGAEADFMPEVPRDQLHTGKSHSKFFTRVSSGEFGMSDVPWQPEVDLTPVEAFWDVARKYVGNFDEHIARSIPTFREAQVIKGEAVVRAMVDRPTASVLDIGGSDGSWAKAITERSGGKIKSLVVDPNPSMHQHFETQPVEGAAYDERAFIEGWMEDDGTQIEAFESGTKHDVVHESMAFQFISPDRNRQIQEAKKFLKPDGIFITEEKVLNDDWAANEKFKDTHFKNKYFTPQALKEKDTVVGFAAEQSKQETAVVGMTDKMVRQADYERLLSRQFKYVSQYWDSGNFKGYVASDSLASITDFFNGLESLNSEYSNQPTPRPVDPARALDQFRANETLRDALRAPNWMIITATQEAVGDHKHPDNAAANERLWRELVSDGFHFIEVEGKYKGVGQGTNFLVVGADRSTAIDYAKRYKQESVAVPEGFVYQDGRITPMVHEETLVAPEALQEDFYTQVDDGVAFSFGLDWDTEILPDGTERKLNSTDQAVRDNSTDGLADNGEIQGQYMPVSEAGAENASAARNAWEKLGTRSPYFRRWFRGSKVVDDAGEPLMVYHGTRSRERFEAFEPGRGAKQYMLGQGFDIKRQGIFTTPDKAYAHQYTSNGIRFHDQQVLPLYVALKNPYDLREKDLFDLQEELDGSTEDHFAWVSRVTESWEIFDGEEGVALVKALRKKGYDGAIIHEDNHHNDTVDVYIAFDPEQVKSADQNQGTFAADDARMNFMPTTASAQNVEYMQAARSGDLDTAQRMVDAAAKAAGYTIPAVHGTGAEFTVFAKDKTVGGRHPTRTLGYFAAPDTRDGRASAEGYARRAAEQNGSDPRVLSIKLRMENPYEMTWDAFYDLGTPDYARAQTATDKIQRFKEDLLEKGYDSIRVSDADSVAELVVFKPEQVKSADPVVRDDDGNIVPLSKRFDPQQDDIRFMPSTEDAQLQQRPVLEHSVGDVSLPLIHFSRATGLTEVDPKHMGKSRADPGQMRGAHTSMYFIEGSSLGQDLHMGFNRDHAYGAVVDGSRIYDLRPDAGDPLGYWNGIDREEADMKLIRAGYAGRYLVAHDDRQVVVLYEPLAVQYKGVGTGGDTAEAAMPPPIDPGPSPYFMPDDAFYSQAVRVAERKIPSRTKAEQALAILRNPQNQIRKEELEWTGIEKWLEERQGQFVTRDDVVAAIQSGLPAIRETALTSTDPAHPFYVFDNISEETQERFATENEALRYIRENDPDGTVLDYDNDGGRGESNTKYHKYTLDGGENYREILFTLPALIQPAELKQLPDGSWRALSDSGSASFGESKEQVLERFRAQQAGVGAYKSSHWDEPNVLAHARVHEFTAPNYTEEQIQDIGRKLVKLTLTQNADSLGSGAPEAGVRAGVITEQEAAQYAHARGFTSGVDQSQATNRILLVEEIQSDWHQAGRKKGYGPAEQAQPITLDRFSQDEDQFIAHFSDGSRTTVGKGTVGADASEAELRRYFTNILREKQPEVKPDGVPDAPFKKTWPELVLKRMLLEAVEGDHNALAWTPGDIQVERYDLSKQVKRLYWYPTEGATTGTLIATAHDRGEILNEFMEATKVEDYVGKEVARRLLEAPTQFDASNNTIRRLDGDGLKVGGEGMEAFYDKMLPSIMNKLAKRMGWKERVSTIKLPDDTEVHSFAITDDIRQALSDDSMPMFMPATTPEGSLSELRAKAATGFGRLPKFAKASSRFVAKAKDPSGKLVDKVFGATPGKNGMRGTQSMPLPNIELRKNPSAASTQALYKKAQTHPDEAANIITQVDGALSKLMQDPQKFAAPKGYAEYMRDAGVVGDVLVPPGSARMALENPEGLIALMRDGFHEEKTVAGTREAAMKGLDAVTDMRDVIQGTPPDLITALHHLWGILSRQLPPLDQEALWLRLVTNQEVLEQIDQSLAGTFSLTDVEWKTVVARARESTRGDYGVLGNNATSNANAFHGMLEKHNGRWGQVSAVYSHADPVKMRYAFNALGHGASGIKNKVQSFIGLTFGVKGTVLDRWRFVDLYLDTAMRLTETNTPREYFGYWGNKNQVPEDPVGLYKTYGTLENASPIFSLALYSALDRVYQKAIDESPALQSYLGDHADPGGLHWVIWNAIKNESVGHSSLDLTKAFLLKYGRGGSASEFASFANATQASVEGSSGSETLRLELDNGEFKLITP